MKKKLFFVMVIALSLCLLFCACKGIDNERNRSTKTTQQTWMQ